MEKANQPSINSVRSSLKYALIITGIFDIFRDLSIESLHYLSSEQALADLSFFIQGINSQYSFDENTKWIAFGGSYPGSLAAWVREKYPNLVHGAISTSGPLLAKADFYGKYFGSSRRSILGFHFFSSTEYYDVVRASLATFSDECVSAVEKSFEQVEILLRHMIGQKSLNVKFKYATQRQSIEYRLLEILFIKSNIRNPGCAIQLKNPWRMQSIWRIFLKIWPVTLRASFSTTRTTVRMQKSPSMMFVTFLNRML